MVHTSESSDEIVKKTRRPSVQKATPPVPLSNPSSSRGAPPLTGTDQMAQWPVEKSID